MEALPKAADLITVKLDCGDQITSKNPPLHANTKYVCPAKRGHGYNVGWVSYVVHAGNGFEKENPRLANS